jgi:hypothetical protein
MYEISSCILMKFLFEAASNQPIPPSIGIDDFLAVLQI